MLLNCGDCNFISGDDVGSGQLFSEKTFKTHLVPKLLPMFCVRDAHVRLILLTHFSSFCSMFSHTHLKAHILPEVSIYYCKNNFYLNSFFYLIVIHYVFIVAI